MTSKLNGMSLLPLLCFLALCHCVSCANAATQNESATTTADDANLHRKLIGSVTHFQLIDTKTGDRLNLSDGDVVSLSDNDLSVTSLNFVGVASNTDVNSVVFEFDGQAKFQTENVRPFSLCGDNDDNFMACPELAVGKHTVKITTYSKQNGTGTKGATKEVSFEIVNKLQSPTASPLTTSTSPEITGELRKWHRVTVSFTGPNSKETATYNPFLNYRLDVDFTHRRTGKTYNVPGFYNANGDPANNGASSGNQWQCHFAPDEVGVWKYKANFVSGVDVAVNLNVNGYPGWFDGQSGTFNIIRTNKSGRDHRGKGLLEYVNKHHFRFAETGEYFLKMGSDSPENLLRNSDFDNTTGGNWWPHRKDFKTGDPTWRGDKGKGIIGAINYLSNQGMNAFSFLTMSLNGDDPNVFPYLSKSKNDRTRMDVSKLAQWEIVFQHADQMGMYLHFKTQERENDTLLDGGALGTERKLYYRELIARFGHHLAMNFNLGEEITLPLHQLREASDYIRSLDPYNHPIVAHTFPTSNEYKRVYDGLIGESTLDGVSLQTSPQSVFDLTYKYVTNSAKHPWVVANDEQNPHTKGVMPDSSNNNNQARIRKLALWGNLIAGGAGLETYFGYQFDCTDLTCQNWRTRENMWAVMSHALSFFHDNNIPFWNMKNVQSLVVRTTGSSNNDQILTDSSNYMVIYRVDQSGRLVTLNRFAGGAQLQVYWFDPRNGGDLQRGSVKTLTGGSRRGAYGDPPKSSGLDWVVLITTQTL